LYFPARPIAVEQRIVRVLLILTTFSLLAVNAGASTATAGVPVLDVTELRQATDLRGPWLVQAGDDPAYAQPAFDDSHWARFDANGSVKSVAPNSRPEVLWYRMHIRVAPNDRELALEEWNIASAFEVYVNGQRLITNGTVTPFVPNTYSARLLQAIPTKEIATGNLVIALRVHVSRYEWDNPHPGYYATNLSLGEEAALRESMWLTVIGENLGDWTTVLVGIGLGIVALALFSAQRQHREYLWIFLQFFAAGCVVPLTFYEYFHNVQASWDLLKQPLYIAGSLFALLMYFALLRMHFGWWIRVVVAIAAVGQLLSLFGQRLGSFSSLATVVAMVPVLFIIAGVIPVLLFIHMRRGNREAGILLIPVLLQCFGYYTQIVLFVLAQFPGLTEAINRLGARLFNYAIGPFQVTLFQITELSYELSLAIIMVLRSTRISRQQAVLEGEVAAAREVQQVMLPERIEGVPGFAVDSAYLPAQQVGGDFFQILPAGDGGMVVVVGDVAGKGLPAAMLVSVLVGATRGVAEYTSEPAELLANLNERLVGREGAGYSTALVALIRADGWVSIANAGHLSPYLDGREVELQGALPLGLAAGVVYEPTFFYFAPGSRLTFYSDGVVEAQNRQGELFGFERGKQLSMQPASMIVEAAKEFGQADDITVVAITRLSAVANAA
jgi:phosphoserine phosphatase RsbU/P